jgi:hypothetical protein
MAKINLVERLANHHGFVWLTYVKPANVSKRSCKQVGVDPASCQIRLRVCINMIRHLAKWAEDHGVELGEGESHFTPLFEGNASLVENNGNTLIRGVVISTKVLENTTPEGVAYNKARKPRGNAWDNFRSYRLDRVQVDLEEPQD